MPKPIHKQTKIVLHGKTVSVDTIILPLIKYFNKIKGVKTTTCCGGGNTKKETLFPYLCWSCSDIMSRYFIHDFIKKFTKCSKSMIHYSFNFEIENGHVIKEQFHMWFPLGQKQILKFQKFVLKFPRGVTDKHERL